MADITSYLNDPQLSEYLNEEENEKPRSSSTKKRSFQAVVREVVMCHMREVDDVKENYKRGIDVLVKRYKAVKEEKVKLKSKVDFWSEECKKLQYENSKLLNFLKSGLCNKCESQMTNAWGNHEFYKQAAQPRSAEKTAKENSKSGADKSSDEADNSINEGHVTTDGHMTTSDGHASDDTSPAGGSKSRKLKLNRNQKRCRYAATSVKLRRSPSGGDKLTSPRKRLSGSSLKSPVRRKSKGSPRKLNNSRRLDATAESTADNARSDLNGETRSSEDDIVLESPKVKRLKRSLEVLNNSHLISPKLSKLKLTVEANRINKRSKKIMKFKGNSAPAKSPSLFDEGHELVIEDEVIVDSLAKRRTRLSTKVDAEPVNKNLEMSHSVSVQSTPSPSVLSGNVPRFNLDQTDKPETVVSISDSGSSESPKLKSRTKKLSDVIEIDENQDSPGSRKKNLVQTKITREMFMPPKTYLPNVAEFGQGVLTPSKTSNQEMNDLQEAIKRSLDDNSKNSDADSGDGSNLRTENACIESVSAFTMPPVTSTPSVSEKQKEKPKERERDAFKKPQIPKKVPTTPKGHEPSVVSLRRSPRLSKTGRNQISDSLPDLDTVDSQRDSSPSPSKGRASKSRRTLEMDDNNDTTVRSKLSKARKAMDSTRRNDVSMLQQKANGSIDPQINLSMFETVPDYDNETSPPRAGHMVAPDDNATMRSPPGGDQESLDSHGEGDSLEMTCESVVFGPPRVRKNAKESGNNVSKNSSSKNSSLREDRQPTKSPGVTYIPETMDVEYGSDAELDCEIAELLDHPAGDESVQEEVPPRVPTQNTAAGVDDSFDYVPKEDGPNYAYADVVRKRNEREQLKSYTCRECEAYFNADGAAGDNLRFCRHKARYVPPSTPEHFWDLSLPDTQVAQERGYMNITQGQASKFRRKRRLNKLFKSKDESFEENEDEEEG